MGKSNQYQVSDKDLALEINNLSVRYNQTDTLALSDVNLRLKTGESLGIIGESGSGKTSLGRTITGLVNDSSAEISGNIKFYGRETLGLDFEEFTSIRGKGIYMILQDANTHLNPVLKVSTQIKEVLQTKGCSKDESFNKRMKNIFSSFGFQNYKKILNGFPHQFSGGEKQRLLIIIGILCRPQVLIADEPTSSLDTVTKLFVLKELKKLKTMRNISMLIISHDLFTIRQITDKAAVFFRGQLMEYADTNKIFAQPAHPYTKLLIDSVHYKPVNARPEKTFFENSCSFYFRCVYRQEACKLQSPSLTQNGGGRLIRCFNPLKK